MLKQHKKLGNFAFSVFQIVFYRVAYTLITFLINVEHFVNVCVTR